MIVVPQEKIAQYTQAGWWGERTLGELFIETALRQPDRLAVADPPNRPAITGDAARRWTWGELLVQVGRYCAFLDQRGIGKDDIVVVQMPNCVEMHAIYLACAIRGVVVSPVPMQYRAHELSHVLETTQARVAITTARVGKNSAAQQWVEQKRISPSINRVWVYGLGANDAGVPAGDILHAIEPALAQSAPWTAEQLRAHMRAIGLTANDVLTICWTSGTESMPKGVPRSHNEWLIVGLSVIDAGGLQPGAQLLIPYPFVNMAGVSTSLVAWLMVGGGCTTIIRSTSTSSSSNLSTRRCITPWRHRPCSACCSRTRTSCKALMLASSSESAQAVARSRRGWSRSLRGSLASRS